MGAACAQSSPSPLPIIPPPYAEPFPIFCKHVPFLYSRSKTMIVHAATLKRNHLHDFLHLSNIFQYFTMSIFAPFCTVAEVNPMVAAYAQSPLLLLLAPLHLLSLSPRHYLILRVEDSLPHHRTLNSSISSLNYYTYSFQVCGKIPTFFQGQRKWLYFLQQTTTTCILCKNLETRKSNFIDMKMNLFSCNTASEKRLIFVSMAISKSKGALRTRVRTFVSFQIFSISCSFQGKMTRIIGWELTPFPRLGNPGSGWICPDLFKSPTIQIDEFVYQAKLYFEQVSTE